MRNKTQTSDNSKLIQESNSKKLVGDKKNSNNAPQIPELSMIGFANKMQNFYYAPPSDNFWTINVRLHYRDSSETDFSLLALYNNILDANENYDKHHVSSNWEIKFKQTIEQERKNNFIKGFEGGSGIFLAQTVNFRPYSLTVNENSFSQGQSSGGFLTFGKVMQSKTGGNECTISFLISNWDFCEIIIDPWIAAIAKWGLIESSEIKNIKADIIVNEYSISVDKSINPDENYYFQSLVHRKTYKFLKAFPTSRGETSKNYEYNQAGTFKTSTVTFKFDEYIIEYHI